MTTNMAPADDIFGEVIHTYSRAQGIEDGVLVDVSTVAREAGFRWPCAMTRAAWSDLVEWSAADDARKGGIGQDESGRLWDALWMSKLRMRSASGDRVTVEVLRTPREGKGRVPKLARFTLHVGPGDTPEPVLTIMLPDES